MRKAVRLQQVADAAGGSFNTACARVQEAALVERQATGLASPR